MKILTITIPCYNAAGYMRHCIESLLVGGEDVEILIVDDGSTDMTAEIADSYEKQYPTICRAIHQNNGGHGEAINTGLRNASGLYFKVVDSDDWVDKDSYIQIINKLKNIAENKNTLDLMISNYIYDKQGAKHKKVMQYRKMLPVNHMFCWNDLGVIPIGKYILMHSVIYRTQLLRDCKLVLPKHTFYVDNIFVYNPLPYVKTIYYLDVNLYHYFIGREDQSIHETVMINRIDQQIKVNKLMVEQNDIWNLQNSKLQKYMLNYIELITCISSILLIKYGTKENDEKRLALWEYIKQQDFRLYKYFKHRPFGWLVTRTNKKFLKFPVVLYKITQRVVGFN